MPLILAIEPDRHQAAQLASIARGRIGAELVLADSAERALRDLGDRIPDLILTPQLLSPRDDAAITNRLRQLGAAAAYVQTLTIPALATQQPRAQAGAKGLLSKLRRQKAAPAEATGGCAPEVFGEQISVYLERALEARTAQAAAEPPPARVESQPVAAIEAATAILEQFATPVQEPASVVTTAPEPSEPAVHLAVEPVVQEERPVEAPLYIDVTPAPVVDDRSVPIQPEVTRASDSLFRRRVEARPHIEPVPEVVPEPVLAVEPVLEVVPEPVLEPEPVVEVVPAPAPVITAPENAGARHEVSRLKAEATSQPAPEPVVVAPPVVAPEIVERPRPAKPAKPAPKKKARPATPKNDWNFFDPAETRFAVLLARLDEITRHDAAQQAQRPQA